MLFVRSSASTRAMPPPKEAATTFFWKNAGNQISSTRTETSVERMFQEYLAAEWKSFATLVDQVDELKRKTEKTKRETRNDNRRSTTISMSYAHASALLVILSLQLLRLDAVNICGLMCGLMCRFDVWTCMPVWCGDSCQWFATNVWNVNCCYLIARLNSYVVNLCSSDDLKLLLWWIDCNPRSRTKTGHVNR